LEVHTRLKLLQVSYQPSSNPLYAALLSIQPLPDQCPLINPPLLPSPISLPQQGLIMSLVLFPPEFLKKFEEPEIRPCF